MEATVDTREFAWAMAAYQRATGKTMADVVRRQGRNLGFALSRQLRRLSPERGSIRAERLAALAAGGGIRISDTVRKKVRTKRNRQSALVRRELSSRESGRGFLGFAARFTQEIVSSLTRRSRAGAPLGKGEFAGGSDRDSALVLSWGPGVGPLSARAAEGLDTDQAGSAIQRALAEVSADIRAYTERRLAAAYSRT